VAKGNEGGFAKGDNVYVGMFISVLVVLSLMDLEKWAVCGVWG